MATAMLPLLIPEVVLAQVTTTGGCGTYSAGFTQLTQAITAFQDFFYGPFFKVGCLAAFAIAGVVLLLDDGQIGRIGQLILRGSDHRVRSRRGIVPERGDFVVLTRSRARSLAARLGA